MCGWIEGMMSEKVFRILFGAYYWLNIGSRRFNIPYAEDILCVVLCIGAVAT